MNEPQDFSVKFGPRGFTLTYTDRIGDIVFVFEVDSPEANKRITLTKGGLVDGMRCACEEDENHRCAMAFEKTRTFLIDRGFEVEIFDPYQTKR